MTTSKQPSKPDCSNIINDADCIARDAKPMCASCDQHVRESNNDLLFQFITTELLARGWDASSNAGIVTVRTPVPNTVVHFECGEDYWTVGLYRDGKMAMSDQLDIGVNARHVMRIVNAMVESMKDYAPTIGQRVTGALKALGIGASLEYQDETNDLTEPCFVCGTQFGSTNKAHIYFRAEANGEVENPSLCICEDCEEECKSDLSDVNIFGDSDTINAKDFDRILEWGRHAAVMSFTEQENEVNTVEHVAMFFDALTTYLGSAWHPDSDFKDYENDKHERTFTDDEAGELDGVLSDCINIVNSANSDKDVYEYAIESMQRAGLVPKADTTQDLLAALRLALVHYNENDIVECVSTLELAKRMDMPEDVKRLVVQAHEEASIGSHEKTPFIIEAALFASQEVKQENAAMASEQKSYEAGMGATDAKQVQLKNPLSATVKVLILSDTEMVLMFQNAADLDKAWEQYTREDFDGNLTRWLRVKGIPHIEIPGVVCFEAR